MTNEERKQAIINRQKVLNAEFTEITNRWIANGYKRSKADKKREWEIIKEEKELERELDKVNDKTYDCEKWITKFIGNSYESLKAARFDLINQIKDLHGVEVGDDKTGVVGVTVYTEHKIYHYTIHAHYRVEVVKEWKEKGLFGEVTRQETRNIYQAWCEKTDDWSWRY